ncbi:hypothetical protein GGI15_000428 [Coemansia interrupta]|uniref:Uncharacterized protein n=1 Tax=Coemansia interrupta TaxID=1126814 RepID=A0A9W8LNI5_9FUNG|nr:hypothetical protein GGI15_000428 [Coemansia interrupta]
MEFVADMAQILMPSLFMACPNGGCNFTRMLLDIGSVRKYIYGRPPSEHANNSTGPGTADSSAKSSPFLTERQLMDLETGSTISTGSAEPGDTFGFDHHSTKSCACGCACCQSRCCFTSSTASVRSWQSLAWQTKTPGALYFMLNSHAPIDSRISQKVVSETLELAGKAAIVPLPASEKTAEARIDVCSSALAHGDELPPSYHNISVNYTRLGHLHDASSAVAEKSGASSNAQANECEISPPNNTATNAPPHHHHEPATDVEAAAPTFDQKLLEQNVYLMRSVRKLELTNQIIKEAYAAVQETLLAERQSKETQMQALERKHQDDMLKLVEEYQERAEQQQQQQQRIGGGRSYLGSDSDMCDYDYDFNYRNTSSAAQTGTTKSVTAYPGHRAEMSLFDIHFSESASVSSSLSSSRNSSPPTSPKKAPTLSPSSSPHSVPVRDEDDDDDGISIMWDRGSNADASDADTESIYSSSSEDSDDGSDDDSDSGMDSSDDDNEEDNFDDGFGEDGQIVFCLEDGATSISGSDSEHELANDTARSFDDQNADSEMSDCSVEPSAPQLELKHLLSPEDYADIDPAAAVISRYYANDNGTLDIAADIEDIPVDEDDCGGSDNGEFFADSRFSKSDDQALDSLNPQSIWDAMRDPGMSGVVEDTSKSYGDREMERIVQLPADQRIAKFINRASSHLQQGARGGLSLGFMLYNLEMLSSQFASNHKSVLCAFVECLYRLTEAMGDSISSIMPSSDSSKPEAAMIATLPSALARKNREDSRTLQLAAMRIVKLLHTYITAPEDQQTVLQLLEKLSVANEDVRSEKHTMLLRAFYENELVDHTSITDWYGQQPADDTHQPAVSSHAQLIRSKAMPLMLELSDSASSNASALEDLHHQLLNLNQSATGTNSSTAMSTPTHIAAATRAWAGSLTPVSDENTAMTSQSSDTEYTSSSSSSSSSHRNAGTSVLNLGRRPDEPAPPTVDSLRPVKQVTFAVV